MSSISCQFIPLPLIVDDAKKAIVVVKKLTAGFALAVQPIVAETIGTGTDGLIAGEIKIGGIPGYRAMPAEGKKFPVVVIVQEISGVHEHIKDICRRFAKLGYLAIAPELYVRQGDVSNRVPYEQVGVFQTQARRFVNILRISGRNRPRILTAIALRDRLSTPADPDQAHGGNCAQWLATLQRGGTIKTGTAPYVLLLSTCRYLVPCWRSCSLSGEEPCLARLFRSCLR